ncbi:YceI family protein [Mucilaginibacter glaciei]|uniref:YceI family protein n=1 Tax=Mucilaginibacter glaciei TaxID=2772109 RepID=A0A926S376_9SPHI|nr:YceI family protein [Mucilaginibacter glaciei]MBD1393939.1 YceI family protein [Mucilaginibacter glaciei]
MKRLCIALLILTAGNAAFAQLKNNVTRSNIRFEIKNLGIKTGGVIEKMEAEIKFDPANLAASKIEAVADATTINTDNNMRDRHIKDEDYFDVVKYPKITMSSVSFTQKGGNNYVGKFNITIKDKTKLVDLPFTYTVAAGAAQFKGSFKINRRDFGVGGGTFTLSNETTIFIEADTPR